MQVQPSTNINNNKFYIKNHRNRNSAVTATFKATPDAFVRGEETVFCTMKSICEYLKRNKNKIENGKIFNKPVNEKGLTLLMAFLQIKPLPEEISEYKSILFDMMKMPEINYDQKDTEDISALEWIMIKEEPEILSLIQGKKLTQDPMLANVYNGIKNPEFRNKLIELDIYRPPVYKTEEEQTILVESALNKFEKKDSILQDVISALKNSEGYILKEGAVILQRAVESCNREDEILVLPEFINKLKDSSGNIKLEEAVSQIVQKEQDNLLLKEVIDRMNMDEEAKSYMETAKAYFDKVGIKYIQDKDGLLIISEFNRLADKSIDYNKLFKCVKAVIGHCNFAHIDISDCGNLQYIGGAACLVGLENPGKLESIGIDVDLGYPKFQKKYKSDPKLMYTFLGWDLKTTGKIKRMGGTVNVEDSFHLEEVPCLEEIIGDLVISKLYAHGPSKELFRNVNIHGRIIEL